MRAMGARCDICPLAEERAGGPVPSTHPPEATVAVVAETPGKQEVIRGKPLVGPSGQELDIALEVQGIARSTIARINVCACRPPPARAKGGQGDFDIYLRDVSKRGLPDPRECCRPRLEADLAPYRDAIPLGNHAARAVLHTRKGITAIRGGPAEWFLPGDEEDPEGSSGPRRAIATVHPAHVLRQPAWREVFQIDIGRAFRYFTDTLRWEPYELTVKPTVQEIRSFLASRSHHWSYDVETDGKEPLTANLRCIGISIPGVPYDRAIVIPFLSVDGRRRCYNRQDEADILDLLRQVFVDGRLWIGHNARWYDRMVIEVQLGVTPCPVEDTLMLHQYCFPHLRHDLGTMGTTLTDVTSWKADKEGGKISEIDASDLLKGIDDWEAYDQDVDLLWNGKGWVTEDDYYGETSGKGPPTTSLAEVHRSIEARDETLYLYNAKDCIVVTRCAPQLGRLIQQYGLDLPCPVDSSYTLLDLGALAQHECVELHRMGMPILEDRRAKGAEWCKHWYEVIFHEMQPLARSLGWKGTKKDADAPWNPNSAAHVSGLLYETLDLIPKGFTPTGAYSVADEHLRKHILDDGLDQPVEDLLVYARRYRQVRNKWYGTYLAPFSPDSPLVWTDARIRAWWNAHGTMVGRRSCSKPNLQTIPADLRWIFGTTPDSGHLLAGADAAQLHPRIIAALWQVERLQETFHAGRDLYGELALILFGDDYSHAPGFQDGKKPKSKSPADKLRKQAKEMFLASMYGAKPPTIYKTLSKAVDAHGRLVMRKLTLPKVELMHEQLLKGLPELERGWDMERQIAEENGAASGSVPWIACALSGRRRFFPGYLRTEDEINELRNFRIIAAEATIMLLALGRLVDAIPWYKWGPNTGLVADVHDSLTVECPADLAPQVAKTIGECIAQPVKGLDVPIESESMFGISFAEA